MHNPRCIVLSSALSLMYFDVYLAGKLFLPAREINSAALKIHVPSCHLGKESCSVL